jgi:[ribosomal protein S5]-alanine N-acetyltransferase
MKDTALFLETSRLKIYRPVLDDFSNWVNLYYTIPEKSHYSSEIIQQWLDTDISHYEKHGFSMGSVYENNTRSFVGRAGLVFLDYNDQQPNIELGYDLSSIYWGKGYATELAKALIGWGFKHLNIGKIVAVTRPHNIKSQNVLKKAGMQQTGKLQFHHEDFLLYRIEQLTKPTSLAG